MDGNLFAVAQIVSSRNEFRRRHLWSKFSIKRAIFTIQIATSYLSSRRMQHTIYELPEATAKYSCLRQLHFYTEDAKNNVFRWFFSYTRTVCWFFIFWKKRSCLQQLQIFTDTYVVGFLDNLLLTFYSPTAYIYILVWKITTFSDDRFKIIDPHRVI